VEHALEIGAGLLCPDLALHVDETLGLLGIVWRWFGLAWHRGSIYQPAYSSNNGNSSWRGSPLDGRDRLRLWRASERRLARPSATRRRIGQALALHTEERAISPFQIINSESDSIVVSEIELGGVTVQMSLGDVEITAVDSALQDREIIFGSVGVPEIGADVFLGAVVHRAVAGELPTDGPVNRAFIGHQIAGAIYIRDHDRSESLCGYVRDVEAADPAIALDQRQHCGLRRDLAFAVCGLATDESLVALDNLICAAERAGIGDAKLSHGLADAMSEEPRGLQAALEGALELAGADALLRRAEQIDRLEPHPHRDVAGLEHGADLDGEGLATGVTLAEAETVSLAPQPTDLFAGRAAVRTDWAIGPQSRFDVFVSGFFAVKLVAARNVVGEVEVPASVRVGS
jgi:hypothetical protein